MNPNMPQPTEQHRKLQQLAGTWAGEEKMFPSPWDPKGGPAQATTTSRMEIDGLYLITDYLQERDGKPVFRGHGVYTWDSKKGCYLWWWFDSISPTMTPAEGQWEGDTLMFRQAGPGGHQRFTYQFPASGKYTFKMEHSQDGRAWSTFLDSTFVRR